MSAIYGVDSILPANTKLTNGYDLYTWVMRMSCFPSFWGRSLTGPNQITEEEIDFLRGKRCKVALLFDELTEAGVSVTNGANDAVRAIDAAKALGIPEHGNTVLFASIDDSWSVNHNWMISFAYTLVEAGYVPGFIGNTDSSKNFNFGRQCSHYFSFMSGNNDYKTLYWGTEPKPVGEPQVWTPYCPSAMTPSQIDLWRTGVIPYSNYANFNMNYARDESILKHML